MSGFNNGAVLEGKVTQRGTSNKNVSGNSEDRRRRRAYLIETYRANYDLHPADATVTRFQRGVQLGEGIPAARCYRCALLLTVDTVTVDRIIPGCQGGRYVRNNIRPACGPCNSETGGALARRGRRRS